MRHASFPSSFEGLLDLIARLRGPDGCPWDREQSRDSLKRQLLEEVYELLDAIDEGDPRHIAEETGDVLCHVAFQINLGVEAGETSAEEPFRSIVDKLVRRHPHVFAEADAKDPDEVASQWEEIKRRERRGADSVLSGVTTAQPALAFAHALQERAHRVGFDWEAVGGVVDKVREELDELVSAETAEERETELGDVLFSMVNLARWLDLDAEDALRRAGIRFQGRFAVMERVSRPSGPPFAELSMDEKETLWEQAKLEP